MEEAGALVRPYYSERQANAPALVVGCEAGVSGGLRECLREETGSLFSGRTTAGRQLINGRLKLRNIGSSEAADIAVLERAAGGLLNHIADGTLCSCGNAASGHQEFVPQLIEAVAAG